MTVWTLIVIFYGFSGPPGIVIDNIATAADCQRVAKVISLNYGNRSPFEISAQCIAIHKVKP